MGIQLQVIVESFALEKVANCVSVFGQSPENYQVKKRRSIKHAYPYS